MRRFEDGLYSRLLTLNAGCELLGGPRPDLPGWVRYIGRFDSSTAAFPHPDERIARVLAGKAPVVLVTQGTFDTNPDELLRPAIRALGTAGVSVIATINPAELAEATTSDVTAVPRVAFASIMDRVGVFVTNGGWGGVLEALEHGVPVIIAGGSLDKPTIAMHVDLAGVGIDMRTATPSEDAIRAAVRRVLADESFRTRAQAVGRRLRDLGGSGAAAVAIESLVARPAP